MYYRLKEPYVFRGWKKTPFAIAAVSGKAKHERPVFFKKEDFLDLLYCNGEEDVDISGFGEGARQTVREMLEHGEMEASETPLPALSRFQRYFVYPSRYVEAVHWSITGKCNFNCRHCLVSAPDAHHPQLPLDDCLHIVHEIARCGINKVQITGGEPFVRNDFEEIVKELVKYGIDISLIFTNASLLTKDILDMLKACRQYPAFQLSFDGLGHHDWLRGIMGAERQADTAFRLLQEYGVPVNVAMCIHKENKDCLRDTVNYLADLGVNLLRLNSPQKLGLWKQYSSDYALGMDEFWEICKAYIPRYFEDGMPVSIELEGFFRCKKGSADYKINYVHNLEGHSDYSKLPYCESTWFNTYIGPDGKVAPCMGFSDTVLKERFPSVLETPLAEITLNSFYQSVADTRLSSFVDKNPECRDCGYLAKCAGGCMLQDMTDDGDYIVPDQRSCYFFKHIGEAAVREAADAAIRKYCPEKQAL